MLMRFLRDSNEMKIWLRSHTHEADDTTVEGIEAQNTMLLSVIKRKTSPTTVHQFVKSGEEYF
jgi:hypothetical protein